MENMRVSIPMAALPLFYLLVFVAPAHPAETPETILIRKVINADKFGKRTGDAEIILPHYARDMAVYEGHNTIDPRGWSVLHEDYPSFERDLQEDLLIHRYDTERTVPFILAREEGTEKKAIVTTIDSGVVINRQTGETRPLRSERLWFFTKLDDEWKVSGYVQNLGDSTSIGVTRPSDSVDEIADLLDREKESWENGDSGSIAGFCNNTFTAYNGNDKILPASWKILFNDAEELKEWLDKRLRNAKYKIDRQVVHTSLSEGGREALALTRESISATYEVGPAAHELKRYVLWMLSRRSGDWRITHLVYNIGLPLE